jgi:hypothetical protein
VSRWLLVELEPDLAQHYTTRTGVWCSLKQIAGIKSITDISAISRRTADALVGDCFLPDDQALLPKPRKARA